MPAWSLLAPDRYTPPGDVKWSTSSGPGDMATCRTTAVPPKASLPATRAAGCLGCLSIPQTPLATVDMTQQLSLPFARGRANRWSSKAPQRRWSAKCNVPPTLLALNPCLLLATASSCSRPAYKSLIKRRRQLSGFRIPFASCRVDLSIAPDKASGWGMCQISSLFALELYVQLKRLACSCSPACRDDGGAPSTRAGDLHPSLRALYVGSARRVFEHRWPDPYPVEEEIDNGEHLRRPPAEDRQPSRGSERGLRSGALSHRPSPRAGTPDASRGCGHGAEAQVLLELQGERGKR